MRGLFWERRNGLRSKGMHLFGGCGGDARPELSKTAPAMLGNSAGLCHFSSEHLPLVFERVATFLVHSKAG